MTYKCLIFIIPLILFFYFLSLYVNITLQQLVDIDKININKKF